MTNLHLVVDILHWPLVTSLWMPLGSGMLAELALFSTLSVWPSPSCAPGNEAWQMDSDV
jgi:hypothetical protein